MPSKTEIANKIELSRQTVHKHLKEYANHPEHLEQIEQFRFMTSKVLAKVFQFAVNGDVGAAKLYFNIVGFMNNGQTPNNTLIQNQNNYIQINGTVLSQETIKHLNPEQLNTIETILKTALPQPEVLEVDKLKN
jgi:predicted transcriptional regulator